MVCRSDRARVLVAGSRPEVTPTAATTTPTAYIGQEQEQEQEQYQEQEGETDEAENTADDEGGKDPTMYTSYAEWKDGENCERIRVIMSRVFCFALVADCLVWCRRLHSVGRFAVVFCVLCPNSTCFRVFDILPSNQSHNTLC